MPHMSKYTSWYSHASSAPFSMQKNTYPPPPTSASQLAQRGSRGLADRANDRDEVEREGDDGE